MRNLPEHDPVKWSTFIAYNKRDVETEMAIRAEAVEVPCAGFPVGGIPSRPGDQRPGHPADMVLVEQAIAIDNRSREELSAKMRQLTALENPNSVQQMKAWLSDNGLKTDTLGKKLSQIS